MAKMTPDELKDVAMGLVERWSREAVRQHVSWIDVQTVAREAAKDETEKMTQEQAARSFGPKS